MPIKVGMVSEWFFERYFASHEINFVDEKTNVFKTTEERKKTAGEWKAKLFRQKHNIDTSSIIQQIANFRFFP